MRLIKTGQYPMMNIRLLITGALALGLYLMAFSGLNAAPLSDEKFPAPGKYIDVDKRRMHLYCTGQGTPTVILDAGLGGTSLEWVRVQPAVARFSRVCSYDRSGYGWSESIPGPRTSTIIVKELEQLLRLSEEPGPYILVGHSFAGLNVRLFASRYPERIAGLVLVDPTHEEQFERLTREELKRPLVPARNRQFVISNHWQIPDSLPTETRVTAQVLALMPDSISSLYSELQNLQLSAEQVRRSAQKLPNVPLTVIAHDSWSRAKSPKAKRMAMTWLQLQRELAERMPYGQLIIARNSGHHVHLEQPEVVIGAIRDVHQQSRQYH